MSPLLTRRSLTIGASATLASLACAQAAEPSHSCRNAFLFCFPLFEFARTGWLAAHAVASGTGYNKLFHRTTLIDSAARSVTTPNNDTLYSSARLDLSNGPVSIDIPTLHDRYFSVAFMDCFTNDFAYVGTRATRGNGGRFLVAPPGWRGDAGDAKLIRAPTADVWMLARVLVAGAEDLPAATAAQGRITIIAAPPPSPPSIKPVSAEDPANLLDVVNEMLARNLRAYQTRRAAKAFASLGVQPGVQGAFAHLPPAQQTIWRTTTPQTLAELRAGGFAAGGQTIAGWGYPPADIGSASASDKVRAMVALSAIGALEQCEATYLLCQADEAGAPLSGAFSYALTLPAQIPASAFWSLTMYQLEPNGQLFFVQNALNRSALGDRTQGLIRGSTGAVSIVIGVDDPKDPTSNWLPAPTGAFALVFRAYLPQAPLLDGSWRLPAVRRLRG